MRTAEEVTKQFLAEWFELNKLADPMAIVMVNLPRFLNEFADERVQEALNQRSHYREDCGCCDGCEQGFGCEYPDEGC